MPQAMQFRFIETGKYESCNSLLAGQVFMNQKKKTKESRSKQADV